MKMVLQVALDFMNLPRAMRVAEDAVRGGADWVEAGTPLIKSEGLEAVRSLKKAFPDHTVVADLNAMDVGGLETEMAAKAGADVITVLGVSDNGTIEEAVRAGRNFGARIMVDMIGVDDKVERAKEVEKLGADYICIHVGIDQQMKGKDPFEELKRISGEVSIPVAVAGGINSESAPRAVENGASIVIVGGAIIKAEEPEKAARSIKEAMESGEGKSTELYRKYGEEEIRKAFELVSTPNISDAMHRKGAMHGILPRINPGKKMIGRAITVRTMDGDWAKPVEAIERAEKGDVIVIDAGGGHNAIWGELASWSCKVKGISGVVIDGAARDIDAIKEMDFPVFSRNISSNAGEPKGYGEIGSEIACGGQTVREGDWIIGDESGVVVAPRERAVEIANRALDVREHEDRIRAEIREGKTLSEVMELDRWEKIG